MLTLAHPRPRRPQSRARGRLRLPVRALRLRPFLVAAVAAALPLALPEVAAADRDFVFHGHSVHTSNCQADVKVNFHAIYKKGHFTSVSQFVVSNLNFPNELPPRPYGHPSGECRPGEHAWMFVNYRRGLPAVMLFDEDHPKEFNGEDTLFVGDPPHAAEQWVVGGKVSIHRVRHHFRVSAAGDLGLAVSEAGLRPGSSSSGQVQWVAKGHEE